VRILQAAATRYPQERAIAYALVENLLADHQADQALKVTVADLQSYTTDARMHGLQAQTYALLGNRLQQHRAQAEAYALKGLLPAAVEQLQLAQKATDGNFYEHSQVDARLRELMARQAEELKEKKQQR
jgi:predicted Zn-dependent protease